MKPILLCIILIVILIGSTELAVLKGRGFDVDNRTKEICKQMAEQNKKDYKDTEFANLDFYQMCTGNIRYDSPLMR